MDAHFREYLAAIAGMQDVYGERADHDPSEHHDDSVPAIIPTDEDVGVSGTIWDE